MAGGSSHPQPLHRHHLGYFFAVDDPAFTCWRKPHWTKGPWCAGRKSSALFLASVNIFPCVVLCVLFCGTSFEEKPKENRREATGLWIPCFKVFMLFWSSNLLCVCRWSCPSQMWDRNLLWWCSAGTTSCKDSSCWYRVTRWAVSGVWFLLFSSSAGWYKRRKRTLEVNKHGLGYKQEMMAFGKKPCCNSMRNCSHWTRYLDRKHIFKNINPGPFRSDLDIW